MRASISEYPIALILTSALDRGCLLLYEQKCQLPDTSVFIDFTACFGVQSDGAASAAH
jgi:hypothetical protein